MTFHVYPDPQLNPLSLSGSGTPGAIGSLTAITEPAGLSIGNIMYLRVAMSDPAAPPTSGTPPTIRLRADTGDFVEIPVSTVRVHIYNRPGTNPPDRVARANINPAVIANDVYQVEITMDKLGSTWTLQIQNNDIHLRDFVCVLADDFVQSQQPWIHMPYDLDFGKIQVGANQAASIPRDLFIVNQGTGPLTLLKADNIGPIGASPFAVAAVPEQEFINPNQQDWLQIKFTPPPIADRYAAEYTVISNDTTTVDDGAAVTHNKRVVLNATVIGIRAITPNYGHQGDETHSAVITGEGLAGATEVTFLLNEIADPKIMTVINTPNVTDSQVPITLTIAQDAVANLAALRTIRVTVPGWRLYHQQAFTVAPRTVTRIVDGTGHQGDDTRPVFIIGTGLAGATQVDFLLNGGVDPQVTAVVNTSQVTDDQIPVTLTIAQGAAPGERALRIRGAAWHIDSVPTFMVAPRTADALSVDLGRQGDLPRLVTLTGEGLAGATQVDLVLPNGDVDTKVTAVVDAQHLTDIEVPVTITIAQDADPGERTLHIAGQTWRIVGSKPFTVNRRLMTKIEDSQGHQGDEQCGALISGEGLAGASTVSFLRNGEIDPSVTAIITAQPATDNQIPVAITVRQDAVLGAHTIRIAGSQWQIDGDKVFTVAPRSVTGITSTIGCQGDTKRDAIITGEGLAGANGISFLLNGEVDVKIKAAVGPQQVTDQQIPVMITIDQNAAIGAAAARTIRVTGPTWRIDAGAGIPFSVAQMKIKSITPNWGRRGEQIASTITGEHLAGVEAVTFSGKTFSFIEHGITAQIAPGGNDTTVPVSIAIGRHTPLEPARDFTVRTQWGAVAHSGAQKFDVHLHDTEMLGNIRVLCTLTRQALLEVMAKLFGAKGYMGEIENTYAHEFRLRQQLITMVLAGDSPDLAITVGDYQFPAALVSAKGKINGQEFYIYAKATTLSNKLQVAAFREFLLQSRLVFPLFVDTNE